MDIIRDIVIGAKEHWVILICVLLAVLIYWHYVITFTQLKELGLPGPTPLPIVGNFWALILHAKTLHKRQLENLRTYGRVFGFYLFKTPTIVVSDPEILKVILVKEFEKFHDRPVSSSNTTHVDIKASGILMFIECFESCFLLS